VVAHALAREVMSLASPAVYFEIPNCIETLIINEMLQACFPKKKYWYIMFKEWNELKGERIMTLVHLVPQNEKVDGFYNS